MAELKYSHLLFTGLKDEMHLAIDYLASPSATSEAHTRFPEPTSTWVGR